ncbi:MAG: hypothetical protein RH949_09570 [Coleofasciculus sp. A1-SPW-01]|uniref:hypothetical protein n=1 Tax=Coleofasciculus sp. A1-SPW-01 TaxID=3070819 RepID=UPI0032F395E6
MYSELQLLLFDFCRMHQIVYKEIAHIEEGLTRFTQENKRKLTLSSTPYLSEEEYYKELQKTRILDSIIAQDQENKHVIGFIDQMCVVGLWALAEQFLGKIYRTYIAVKNSVDANTVSSPYKWDDFKKQYYERIGVDLSTCDGFQDANKCRLVNNAIKHNPIVGQKLEGFPDFAPHKGKKLMEVPLDMQCYLNGVNNFLGSLMEKVEAQLDSSNA